MMKVKMDGDAKRPNRAHPYDAGLDLFASDTVTVPAHGWATINTGTHVQIPQGCWGLVISKSGLMREHGLTCRGCIDSGYVGAIQAVVFNHSDVPYTFHKGDKVTQLVVLSCMIPAIQFVDELDETDRGENGFGSTGR